MTYRHEYYLDLAEMDISGSPTKEAGLELRAVARTNVAALAELMIETYRETIDRDGETLTEGNIPSERLFMHLGFEKV